MVCYLSLASTNVLDKNNTKPNVYITISKYVSNLQTNITDIPQAQTLAIKLYYAFTAPLFNNFELPHVIELGLWYLWQLSTIFRYIVGVSFIGGGNVNTRRKPPICHKSLTNFIT